MKLFFIGLLIWMFAGCGSPDRGERVIRVDAGKIQDGMNASVVFDSIKYIPLETNDSSLFKNIDKLCIDSHGNIFVLDIEGTNAVYMFGKEGEFKRRIGQLGRGPGEYNEISDLNLYRDSMIEIYDSGQDKLIHYDTAGKVVDEIYNITVGDAQLFHVGDTLGFYRSNGKNAYSLKIWVGDKEYSYLKQDYLEMRDKRNYFYTDGERMYCTDNYNDTLYLIENGMISPYLYIDFQKNKLPEKIRIVEQAWQGNYCFDIGDFKFTSRFINFSFSYRQDEIFAFYDCKNKSLWTSRSFLNDIDGIPILINSNTPNSVDKIITYLEASIFLSVFEEDRISETAKTLKSKVHEDSNPIVVFAYTKK